MPVNAPPLHSYIMSAYPLQHMVCNNSTWIYYYLTFNSTVYTRFHFILYNCVECIYLLFLLIHLLSSLPRYRNCANKIIIMLVYMLCVSESNKFTEPRNFYALFRHYEPSCDAFETSYCFTLKHFSFHINFI